VLETLRKQGASIVIYAVFGILIAVFVINFGAQSVGTSEGCRSSGSESVATVDGHDVGMPGWRWAGNFMGQIEKVPKEVRAEKAMEWLIVREILVREAEARGLSVSEDLVNENLKVGRLAFEGQTFDGRGLFFLKSSKGVLYFDYDGLAQFARAVGLSVGALKEQQRKETLAAMMTQIMIGEGRASKEEARTRYLAENNKVAFDIAQFSPETYGAALTIGDADVTRWLAAHDADVKKQYDADQKQLYSGRKPEVHVREIYIPKPPTAQDTGAGSGSGSGSAAPAPAPAPKDDGAEKLTAARAAILAKKQTFADAASKLDFNDVQRARGGDVGWRTLEALALGDPKLDDAVRGLAVGTPSEVITTDDGHYLFFVEDKRSGDLSYDQVKREIATTLVRKAWGDEAAKRAALAALDAAKAGKPLREQFTLGMNPEEKMRIQQEMQQREMERLQKEAGTTGSITIEGPDVPAVWGADDAKPPAGAPAVAPPAPPAAPVDIKATTETLPTLGKVDIEAIPFTNVTRTGEVYGFHPTAEIKTALFDQLADGKVADRVYLVDGQYTVVQLVKKTVATPADFDKKADTAVADMARERGFRLLTSFLHDRCFALANDHKITYDQQLVAHTDDKGKQTLSYRPCESLATEDDLAPAAE
jgi:hypothetical protein